LLRFFFSCRFEPVHFAKDIETGESKLTPKGEAAVKAELEEISEDDGVPTPRAGLEDEDNDRS